MGVEHRIGQIFSFLIGATWADKIFLVRANIFPQHVLCSRKIITRLTWKVICSLVGRANGEKHTNRLDESSFWTPVCSLCPQLIEPRFWANQQFSSVHSIGVSE
jgi:hypothetical protein